MESCKVLTAGLTHESVQRELSALQDQRASLVAPVVSDEPEAEPEAETNGS